MESIIREMDTDRVVTVSEVIVYDREAEKNLYKNDHYKIEESDSRFVWTDEMIECIEVPVEPISNRFEILDL